MCLAPIWCFSHSLQIERQFNSKITLIKLYYINYSSRKNEENGLERPLNRNRGIMEARAGTNTSEIENSNQTIYLPSNGYLQTLRSDPESSPTFASDHLFDVL